MELIQPYTINEVLSLIEHDRIRIPLLSRPYVWTNEDVERLFCAIFLKQFFGVITVIKQIKDYKIFEHKSFKSQNTYTYSWVINKDNPLYMLLDGHQRLRSIYDGLTKAKLYFDVKYCDLNQAPFKYFAHRPTDKRWILVKDLYNNLKRKSYSDVSSTCNNLEKENIFKFYYAFLFEKNILMSELLPNGENKVKEDRKRFKRLFISINTFGGMSAFDNPFIPKHEDRIISLEKIRKVGSFFLDNPMFPNDTFNFKVLFYGEWSKELYIFVTNNVHIDDDDNIYIVMESFLKLFYFTGINMSDGYSDMLQLISKNIDKNLKTTIIDYLISKFKTEKFEIDEKITKIMAYYSVLTMINDFEKYVQNHNNINFINEKTLYTNCNEISFPFLIDSTLWLDLDCFELNLLGEIPENKKVSVDVDYFSRVFGSNFSSVSDIALFLYEKLDESWNKKEKVWNDYLNKLTNK